MKTTPTTNTNEILQRPVTNHPKPSDIFHWRELAKQAVKDWAAEPERVECVKTPQLEEWRPSFNPLRRLIDIARLPLGNWAAWLTVLLLELRDSLTEPEKFDAVWAETKRRVDERLE